MTDEQIIQLFFARDEKAIEETCKKYGKYCSHIAYNILGDPSDVEECVNDTWMNVWNAIPPKKPDHMKLFLASIIRNLAFNRYRRNTTLKRGSGEVAVVLDELEECIADGSDVETLFFANDLKEAINRFVRTLPAREGNILIRRYYYSDSMKDISKQYSLSENAVRTILFRTRKKLRAYLEKEGYIS